MKIIEIANGHGDLQPTNPKSLLEQRLAELHATVRQRQKDWAAALAAASDSRDNLTDVIRQERAARITLEEQLAQRQAQYEIDIARAEAVRAMIDEQIREAALEVERARHAEASAAALVTQLTQAEADAVARLAEREEQFATELSTVTATRDGLEQQLSDAESALGSARHRHALTVAEVERLTRREAELISQSTTEAATRAALERRLAEVEAALLDSSEQLSHERTLAADQLAAYQERLEQETATRRGIEQDMASARTAHVDAEKRHEAAMAAAAARLAAREAEFEAELSTITGARDSLEQELRSVEAELTQETESRSALQEALAELRLAAVAAEQRFRDETATLIESADAERARLKEQMSRDRRDHETQRADEHEQHRSALAAAATRLAEREAQFEAELSTITGARDSLVQQLCDVEGRLNQANESRRTLEQAIADAHAEAADAERRARDEIATITENARTERARLESEMSRERRNHETELASITATRNSLEQQLRDVEARLTHETASRTALEQAITDARSATAAAEVRFREETATIVENARVERVCLEDQMSRERRDLETRLTDEQRQHRSAMAVAATRLAEREGHFAAELASITAARDSLQRRLTDVEAALARETESRTVLEQAIAEMRSAAADAERRFHDNIAAITETARTERARLEDQISQQRVLSAERLAARGAEFEAELRRLSSHHANALAKFQSSVAERDSRLEEQARGSAALQHQLDASEAENRRQFEETPVPLIRCSRDVGVAGVNRAFAALVGFRAPRDLRDQVVATLFESRDDLIWLIERSMSTRKTESVETTCIRKDGTRVAVRLSARPSVSGLVEIAAEDLTVVRVLEDRLREAHRMEAVGRLASEIAGTCEKLLRDVYRDAQRLLTMMSGTEAPQRSEALLDEVTRVGSFLHQLVAYGHEQAAAQVPVDVNRILRDLEPVLRQVAGSSLALDLRKASSPVHVDVNAERVERLLVNVASYGRERMPHGGRLRIELATVVVDGKFIAQHPNVRQGPHALITVTEVARPIAEGSVSDGACKSDAQNVSGRPGVDLTALQELISECGGHLWITAEPGGSMVVKMRLPLRAPWEGQAERRARHGLGRVTARLLGR